MSKFRLSKKEKFDFPKGKGADIHVVIYVPSTKKVVEKISDLEFKKRINDTVRFLRGQLGGSTTVGGIGNYNSSQYGSVTENVAKVEAFTKTNDYDKADLKIKKWLQNKKKEWSQESISYEFEEELHFV